VGLPVADQAPALDPPMTKQRQCWSRGKESGHVGVCGAEVQVWESAVGHTALPEGRVSARSAFQTPEASLLGHNGCTPPSRSHHGQGRGQRWTCLEGEQKHVIMREQAEVMMHYSKWWLLSLWAAIPRT